MSNQIMASKPRVTSSRHAVLVKAIDNGGVYKPNISGDYRMVRRLAADGFGSYNEALKMFYINDAGRLVVKKAEG